MNPAPFDLPTIWRGCDWAAVTLKWKDANGDPFNLLGWFPIAWTSGFSLNAVITDSPQGITQIKLSASETAILKLGVYQWNWIWEHPAAPSMVIPPLLAGKVEVKNPITPI